MGIKHRGEIDFGTIDTRLLLQLKRLDEMLEMETSKYASIVDVDEFVDTGEKFILMPVDESVLASIADVDAAEAADWGGDAAGELDAGCETDEEDEQWPQDKKASRAQAELLESLHLPANVRLVVPKYPTLHEVELFQKLLPPNTKQNGSIEWDKIVAEWLAAHAANLELDAKLRRRIGLVAHCETLKKLHEHVKKRDHLLQSLEPLEEDRSRLDRVCFQSYLFRPMPVHSSLK